MITSNSTKNWEHRPGAPVGYASSAFLEIPAELLIKSQVRGRHENYDTLNKSIFTAQMDTP